MDALPVVLEIDLSLGLLSGTVSDPLTAVRTRNMPRLSHLLAGLRHAGEDDKVVAVVVHVTPAIRIAEVEELVAALRSFAGSGKKVIAWSESFGELAPGTVGYYLATAADEIWLQPSGTVGLQGIGLEVSTIRGTLDKIGVTPQLGQRKEYKTAAEMYSATEISEPNREMTGRLCESVSEQVVRATASSRELSEDQVTEAMRSSPLRAEDALERGLIDKIGYRDDVYQSVRDDHGVADEEGVHRVKLQFVHRYSRSLPRQAVGRARQRNQPVIAVVDVQGGIITGRGGSQLPGRRPQAGSDTVTAALRSACADDEVRAVVLRVDSPGGSYVASDAIRAAVLRVQQSGRPVVASMGSVAASGGYFVSMAADRIVALPSTLTGSIGVLGGKMVIKGALDKIGVVREPIGTAPATMFSATRPFDEEEWQQVERWLDAVYDDFTHKAAGDRDLDYSDLERHARGRVWTGADARDHGLVDELGGLRTAVEIACRRIGADPERVRVQQHPHFPVLARLKPADSTESPMGTKISNPQPGLLEMITDALGVRHTGILTMPWQLTFR
jgi:protease-4